MFNATIKHHADEALVYVTKLNDNKFMYKDPDALVDVDIDDIFIYGKQIGTIYKYEKGINFIIIYVSWLGTRS